MVYKKKLSDMFRAESGLRLINSLIKHPKHGIVLLDLDGTVMFANSVVKEMFAEQGLARDVSFFQFVHEDDAYLINSILIKLTDSKPSDNVDSLETDIRLKAGDLYYRDYHMEAIGIYSSSDELECLELCLYELNDTKSSDQ